MATLRELKGRIGSVASSEKITGAMKMISSAKMHQAEGALRKLQPYRSTLETIIANLLSSDATFTSPLAEPRPVNSLTMVVLGSDDGLCGAYNVNLAKYLEEEVAKARERYGAATAVTVIPVGKKMAKAAARIGKSIPGVKFAQAPLNTKASAEAIREFVGGLTESFEAGETDAVDLVYMNYKSAGRQVAACDRVLPLSSDVFVKEGVGTSANPYIFEPDAQTIFSTVLPMFVLALVQDAFVENRASEQAARVMAMQSANDNAKKLNEQLKLEYNKLRQQSITTELLDIVGGQVRD